MSISLTLRNLQFPTMLLNVCELLQQRRSLTSLLTGFGVAVAVRVPAAYSPYYSRVANGVCVTFYVHKISRVARD